MTYYYFARNSIFVHRTYIPKTVLFCFGMLLVLLFYNLELFIAYYYCYNKIQ